MAIPKSFFRKWINVRRLRWLVSRAIFRLFPPLASRYNCPVKGVAALDAASEIYENSSTELTLAHSPTERREILEPALEIDTVAPSHSGIGRATLYSQSVMLENCSVLGHTGTIVRERDFAAVGLEAAPANWNQAKPRKLSIRKLEPAPCIVLAATGNYYHFFANRIFPLLHHFERHPPREPVWLCSSAGAPAYEKEVVAALVHAYPALQPMDLEQAEKLTNMQIIYPILLASNYEWMPVSAGLVNALTHILTNYWSRPGEPGSDEPESGKAGTMPRLYIDRSSAKLRQLHDDAEVRAVLAKHDFQSFIAHQHNFREQIMRFSQAEMVVGVHGAGMANLMFCRPGTRVIEIFPSNFRKSTYLWLARRLQLDYHYVIGGPGDQNQKFHAGSKHLEDALSSLLALQSKNLNCGAPTTHTHRQNYGSN